MKINLILISKHGSISKAIEALALDHDSIASGIIGPSFATSGPGPGWSKQYDVNDYANRALADDYGATSYIDSSDGREATMDGDGEVEWSEESVVEIELPTVADALENPEAWAIMAEEASSYGVDEDDIEALADKIACPYEISDGNATEKAATLADAESIVEDWYDYLKDDNGCPGGFGRHDDDESEAEEWEMPHPNLNASSLDALNASIRKWEQEIAHAKGGKDFAGHGNYYVSAADRMGLNLRVSIVD